MSRVATDVEGPSAANPYAPMGARLEDVIVETPTIRTFVLRPERPIPFRAGQFVQLTVPGVGEAPFTPSSSPSEAERIEVTVLRTGCVTEALHELQPGCTLGIRGPFGKGYPIDKFVGKPLLLVGGGVGLAPLRSLILALAEQPERFEKVSIKYGAREPAELLFQRAYQQWAAVPRFSFEHTVDRGDEGWAGRVGVVTTLLEGEPDVDVATAYAVSCGPGIMLRFVTMRLVSMGFPPERIYLSMNRRMSCGIGKCGRCAIGPYYLCKDGPDMNYAKIKDYPNVF